MDIETISDIVKKSALMNDEYEILDILKTGFNPNFESGWPLRLAARYGSYSVAKTLIQHGANPHLLSDTGASTLQLAVYSELHWETDKWSFLLSCYDSSQLADGAAVAIIFRNIPALTKILQTGRCNTHIPTTLTGRTVEQLAKGYKLHHILSTVNLQNTNSGSGNTAISPRTLQRNNNVLETVRHSPLASTSSTAERLSPSVARFFSQTANQRALTPPRPTILHGSPFLMK